MVAWLAFESHDASIKLPFTLSSWISLSRSYQVSLHSIANPRFHSFIHSVVQLIRRRLVFKGRLFMLITGRVGGMWRVGPIL